ncbi:unnamed protein product [Nyctereutes procyonoides]|uniref:(raccoon dog) hypothetical protein n=1 Tax=Nyctereutes procyonoides TaxID=34880 RepID=A0A811YEJ8_NYCPR|nr:unnamed protein product [Nyctereutes procyonoides]
MKAERGEDAAGEKSEAGRGWVVRFEERSHRHDIKVQSGAASADGEAAASDPETLAKVLNMLCPVFWLWEKVNPDLVTPLWSKQNLQYER